MPNNTTTVQDKPSSSVDPTVYLFSSSIALNCIILFVLLRNKRLLFKSAFVVGLTIGDILDSVGLLGNAVSRRGSAKLMVHPSYCMQSYGFSAVLLMGNQVPSVMFFLIGLERMLAVQYFDWYYLKWSNKTGWMCASYAYGYCALSLTAAFIVVNTMPADTRIPTQCSMPLVMGIPYMSYNYMVCIIGGTFAVFATIWAMVVFTKSKRKVNIRELTAGMKQHIARQWNTTRIMLLMAVLDLGLVVVPYVLLFLKNAFGLDAVQNLGGMSLQMGCARSIPNLFIYFCVNAEFRKATLNAFGINTNSVENVRQSVAAAKTITHTPLSTSRF